MGKNSDKKLDNEFGPQAHLLTWEAAADLLIAFGSQIWIDGLRFCVFGTKLIHLVNL